MTNGTKACGYLRVGNPKQLEGRIKACGYLRVSKADQTEVAVGLQTQSDAILKLAEQQGYEIVEWYEDVGHSGSRDSKRTGWLKMLADAPNAEWEVILCHDLSRFSRMDSIEEGCAKQTLREAKKRLHTVVQGLVYWETSVGRIIDTIRSEESNAYSARNAHISLEGKRRAFEEGRRPGGKCPYGYACQVTDPRGNSHSISREEYFAAPRGWLKTLVPGAPEEAEVVRWLFDTYASTDAGIASLASQLKARGVLSPTGRTWHASTVVRILANDIYVGDTRFGRCSSGKFARLQYGHVVKAASCDPNERQGGIVRHNTHTGLVTREVWDRVQAKLNKPSKEVPDAR